MTVFIMVLKKIIKEHLNAIALELAEQANRPMLYIQLLSLQKKNIIDGLEEKITSFVGTGDDEADSKTINKMIEEARVLVQNKQEAHGKPKDDGGTLKKMSNLIFHTNSFFTKLDKFNKKEELEPHEKKSESSEKQERPVKLRLINLIYSNSPETILYSHAALYIGEEIFKPSAKIDLEIRAAKENAMFSRIQSLSERIKPEFGLADRKNRTKEALRDLSMDNNEIITPKTANSFGLPFLTLGGLFSVKVPTTLFNPSEGRFGKLFSLADSMISDMSDLEFQPSKGSGACS